MARTWDEWFKAAEAETRDYLAGHKLRPEIIETRETEHGLEVLVRQCANCGFDWSEENGCDCA